MPSHDRVWLDDDGRKRGKAEKMGRTYIAEMRMVVEVDDPSDVECRSWNEVEKFVGRAIDTILVQDRLDGDGVKTRFEMHSLSSEEGRYDSG